jgi:hypothetical protein
MTRKNWILLGGAGATAVAISALAVASGSKTIRTLAYFTGVAQRPGTQFAAIDYIPIASPNLVNLAMGRDVGDTNVPNQVLALTLECDLSASNVASLVVYDRTASNIVETIATSASFDFAYNVSTNGAGITASNKTNEIARFVSLFQIHEVGSATNALLGGFLTVAGRIHLDPGTGCPTQVVVALDSTSYDSTFADKEIPGYEDKDTNVTFRVRTGLAHMVGVIDLVGEGATNTVLVPLGYLSIRYDLPFTAGP